MHALAHGVVVDGAAEVDRNEGGLEAVGDEEPPVEGTSRGAARPAVGLLSDRRGRAV